MNSNINQGKERINTLKTSHFHPHEPKDETKQNDESIQHSFKCCTIRTQEIQCGRNNNDAKI